ncbi:MAG: PEPxxWA-CTERM sorting domain-containing protein [Sandaracinobacteroides sp.]
MTASALFPSVTSLTYRRAVGFQFAAAPFQVALTHGGIGPANLTPAGNLKLADVYDGQMLNPITVPITGPLPNMNFADVTVGGTSRGSVFDLEFNAPIPGGGNRNFNLFYGSKPTETAALATIAALGIQVFSLAQVPGATGPGDPTWFVGLYGIDGTVPGSTPATPILPFVPAPGQFYFPAPPQAAWYDPPAADGFRYELDGATFLTVGAPPASFGFGPLDIWVGNSNVGSLLPGGSFDLSPWATAAFELRGISPAIDPDDVGSARAFPTFLDFTDGATALRMRALTVPEASTWAMLIAGFGMVGGMVRRRRRLEMA